MRLLSCVTALSVLSMASSAAELGALTVLSHVGERFEARLQVLDVKPEVPVEIGLGSAAYYQRLGKSMAPEQKSIKVTQQFDTSGRVRIVGQETMTTEEFPLVIVMRAEGKTKAKVYNIKLAAAKTPAPVSEPQKQKALVETTSQVAAKATPPAQSATQATSSVLKKERTAAKKAKAASHRTILVRPGMTMWSIAKRTQKAYPKANINQILVAFVRANPAAFEAGRVSRVKVGAELIVPSAKQVRRVSALEAVALVQVKPEANALKKPSKSRLKAARSLLKKTQPASAEKSAQPAMKVSEAPATDALGQLQEKLEAERKAGASQSTVAPEKASEATQKAESTQTAQASAPQSAAPEQSASVALSAAPSANEPKAAAKAETVSEKTAPVEKPAAQTPETPTPMAKPQSVEKPSVKPDAKAEKTSAKVKEEISLNKLLIAIGAAVLALLGAFGFVRHRKGKKSRRLSATQTRVEPPKMTELRPVAFTKEPVAETSTAQIAGIEATVQQRLDSDRHAARGFELKGERMGMVMPAAVAPVNQPVSTEATVTPVSPVPPVAAAAPAAPLSPLPPVSPVPPVQPATAPAQEAPATVATPETKAEPVSKAEPLEALHPATQNLEVPVVDAFKAAIEESMEQKLSKARGYIAASLSDRAIALLEEIALKGNEEQRAAALRLLTGLK